MGNREAGEQRRHFGLGKRSHRIDFITLPEGALADQQQRAMATQAIK